MSRNPKAEFCTRGVCLSLLYLGWTASSSTTAPWLRVIAAVLLVGWVTDLARHLLRRARGRKPAEHPDN